MWRYYNEKITHCSIKYKNSVLVKCEGSTLYFGAYGMQGGKLHTGVHVLKKKPPSTENDEKHTPS